MDDQSLFLLSYTNSFGDGGLIKIFKATSKLEVATHVQVQLKQFLQEQKDRKDEIVSLGRQIHSALMVMCNDRLRREEWPGLPEDMLYTREGYELRKKMREHILAGADPEDFLKYIEDSHTQSGGDDYLVDIVPYKVEDIVDVQTTSNAGQTK